ncbi:histidine phosphatase family protein [Nevskia sp.]|uniref:SixA phosphatase family protein n=1 Tax=Nevskia sp. TaxID=1929292 RepID=UPI0025F737D9|nr:histidine phosphatase family protein [Nevskia sp.]
MKRLTLIRHAMSSQDFPLLGDFERPLNPRGRRDVPVMAQRLAATIAPPVALIASPATRAITTAQGFAEAFGLDDAAIRLEAQIYEATPGTLLHLVNRLDDADSHVLLFGHNPGFSELARLMADVPFAELPPCACVILGFEVQHWRDIVPDSGQLLGYLQP